MEDFSAKFGGQMHEIDKIAKFVWGGSAYFTIVDRTAERRFTYHVSGWKKKPDWYFVQVLTTPDFYEDLCVAVKNIGGFYIKRNRDGRITASAPSYKTFEDFIVALVQCKFDAERLEFWHSGRCCVCARQLTVPESIANGIGPECAGKMGAESLLADLPEL